MPHGHNRTREFLACVEAARDRASGGSGAMHASALMGRLEGATGRRVVRRQCVLSNFRSLTFIPDWSLATDRSKATTAPSGAKSDFARMAAAVAGDIQTAAGKLEKLARRKSSQSVAVSSSSIVNFILIPLLSTSQVAKKKSLFDDRPVEIQELTHIIKQDIARVNGQIQGMERYLRDHGAEMGNRQTQEHSSSIVVSLQSKLATASSSFKDVLELRSQVESRGGVALRVCCRQ